MDRDKIYLEEIKEFSAEIIAFTAGMSFEEFLEDRRTQLATIKLIENVGEASKKISQITRDTYPNVDWKKAAGMRDKLVHEYMSIDLSIVFDVATHEIPELIQNLK